MKIAAKVFLLLPIAFSCFSGEPAFVYGKDSIVSFPENSVADFNPCRDGERLVLILNGDSGENSYSGDTKLLSGTLRMNVSSYKGRIVLRGGTLEIISENPKLYKLDWSSGGFKIDLKKHAPITLAESVNISALPQAGDAFNFENISEGEFCIFKYSKNISPSFLNFSGQIIDCASNGKIYTGAFNADESSLKIVFKKK